MLNKAAYSSALAGETLSHTFAAFEHPVRHERLDDELIARIRLIRAAFLQGNRQTMRSWVDAFSHKLIPTQRSLSGSTSRIFLEAKLLQRAIWASDMTSEATRADYARRFLPDIAHQTELVEQISVAFVELAQLPDDRLAWCVQVSLQPLVAEIVDLGLPRGFSLIISMITDWPTR